VAHTDFIDEIKFFLRAGHGGAGAIHFRRERFIDKGGPDGGDGGDGGNIIIKGNQQLATLLHLKYRKHIIAENGNPGSGACCSGAKGKDIILEVPLGTMIKNADTGEVLSDITFHGQSVVLMKGGLGGKGNIHFKSATRQTPRYAQPGTKGEEAWIKLELKLLADVGLVGLPNAGKSTLLSTISAAKPKIANYPFTTLTPQLGVVAYKEQDSFVMADLPGIIENAALGKGLGLRFLKHIERNVVLVLLIAADTPNIKDTYHLLLKELSAYNSSLAEKKKLLVISKMDLISNEEQPKWKKKLPGSVDYVLISAATGYGIEKLKEKIWQLLHG